MNDLRKNIDRFNSPDTHLVISGYPEEGKAGKNYGIAWYTKETLEPIAGKKGARFVVLAEKNGKAESTQTQQIQTEQTDRNGEGSVELYAKNKILVLRVFDKRQPTLYPRILRWLRVFPKIRQVYVHSEFGANGGVKNFALLIPFLLLIKFSGRKITFFAHNVIECFDLFAPHLAIPPNPLRLKLMNLALSAYNRALGKVVDRIIVLEPVIMDRIAQYVNKKKISLVPMLVKERKPGMTKAEARRRLRIKQNEFVLLYFGFVTWYKGADWLISQVRDLRLKVQGKKIKLIIAGGEAYSLKERRYYQRFYQEQVKQAEESKNIMLTGFVPERQIGKYFQAADLVVFPYRGIIGASGALTYALSYQKPFILSRGLSPTLEAKDIRAARRKAGLSKEEIVFNLSRNSFTRILRKSQSKKQLAKLRRFSSSIAQSRSYTSCLNNYIAQIYGQEQAATYGLSRSLIQNVCPQPLVR